jgi:hypothetical protein
VFIDWTHVIWEGRWQALGIFAHAILTALRTTWWSWLVLVVVACSLGKKGIFRLSKYVARVFFHTHQLF